MYRSLIIVDNFLDNAEALRAQALSLDYPEIEGQFPGRNSLQRVAIDGLSEEVSQIVGEHVVPINPLESHSKFRLTMAGDKGRGRVHIDQSHWSGILYLSRPEDCRGGTEFFRHRRTGLHHAPINKEQLAAAGYASHEEAHRDLIEKDGTDASAWEATMQVPMMFNRLLLIRPWLWHTAGPGFGTSPDNARLIYVMFFQQRR